MAKKPLPVQENASSISYVETPSFDYWIVRHKDPNNPLTRKGTVFVTDGIGLSWSKDQAEQHVQRCEFVSHRVIYEVVKNVSE